MPLSPDALRVCLLSFEGPDRYSQAGGLGVRVTHLAEALARRGVPTDLIFVGDPEAPAVETREDGRLTLRRWGQWISAHHPGGVYDGEEGKRADFERTVPPFVTEEIVRPALAEGRMPVLMAEEWHTAETLCRLHDQLGEAGLRHRCALLWNANNTMAFPQIDWGRLDAAARITTVSRYMKHRMWDEGVNPIVIPNGIPEALLEPVPQERVEALRPLFDPDEQGVMLFKAGRFDPAKRWLMAVEAAAKLKAQGHAVSFPLTGGVEPHGHEVMDRARALGLRVATLGDQPDTWEDLLAQLRAAPDADLYDLRFYLPQSIMRVFFAASDAVLANSGHEPFGLVGLEAMAAGSVVLTGATGEEYVVDGESAIALDTDQPEEIVLHVESLRHDPEREQALRRGARHQAARFTWARVVDLLLDKIAFVGRQQGALTDRLAPVEPVRDVVVYTVVHQPRRLQLPAEAIPEGAGPDAMADRLFDEAMNERYFHKVTDTCYDPALARFQSLVERGFSLAIGFSLSFVEQARRWNPDLLDRFRRLVRHPNVELVAVEPTHSFVLLWDVPMFIRRMKHAADRLEEVFGERPRVADTTEMMMSDTIYHALDRAGYEAAFFDGRPWIMEWREPTHLYRHGGGDLTLLPRHYPLSDDVGYRFSNRDWGGWPLMADTYASWIAGNTGEVVVLGWDFETFGEHHPPESGIFDFLDALPEAAAAADLDFRTPREALDRHGDTTYDLPLPAFAGTWAGSGGLEFFLGNDAQQAVFHLMTQAYNKALLTQKPPFLELALWLAQSDNLHLIQWVGRSGSEAEVSAYFTPQEWWALGPDGIVWEIQQVYKQFIAALDAHLPDDRPAEPVSRPPTAELSPTGTERR